MKSKSGDYILAIDIGTQSIRASLVDLSGNLRDLIQTPIPAYISRRPGWVEQNPVIFWKTLCRTTRSVIKKSLSNNKAIRGVALTTQRSTVINLDKNGRPLRPAIIWMDRRKASLEKWPSLPLKILLKSINYLGPIVHAYKECEANWIRQNQPQIWDKTHKFLFLSGYLNHKLTGEFLDSRASMVGYIPYNYKTQKWANPKGIQWKMFPIDRSILPDLVDPSEILGYITKDASRATGIPGGLPLIASGADKACEMMGSGCLSPEIACLSFGTTATIGTTRKKYLEVVPYFPSYSSTLPGWFNSEVMIYRGFWMLSWFINEFCFEEKLIAKKRGISPEAILEKMVEKIPPGSMGLTIQPYWSPGVKIPGPEAKGAIIGFGDVHNKVFIYKAILEGLIFGLKAGALRTEQKGGVKIERIRVCGGGSQSNTAMQITADIFDQHVEKPHTYETSSVGAAINGAVGLKLYPDFKTAVNKMTRQGRVFKPIPKNRDLYQELFDEVYQKMYEKLGPLYEKIQKITGYP